jgi:hypothetical protein
MPRRDRELRKDDALCLIDNNADHIGKPNKSIFGGLKWLDPRRINFVESYARAEICVGIGVSIAHRPNHNLFAFFKRVSTGDYGSLSVPDFDNIGVGGNSYQVPVFVELVKAMDSVEIASTPSVVWFDAPKEGRPLSTDLKYYSLTQGLIERFSGFRDGEVDFAKPFALDPIENSGLVGNVVQSATQVMDRIAYSAVKIGGKGPGEDYTMLVNALHVRLSANVVQASLEKVAEGVLKLNNVLVGPLQFIPSAV